MGFRGPQVQILSPRLTVIERLGDCVHGAVDSVTWCAKGFRRTEAHLCSDERTDRRARNAQSPVPASTTSYAICREPVLPWNGSKRPMKLRPHVWRIVPFGPWRRDG